MTEAPWSDDLQRHFALFPERRGPLALVADFLAKPGDWSSRANPFGHVVASGIATDGVSVLLIHHRVLQRWLQPGGHLDAGETPWAAARREVAEETGVNGELDPWHEVSGAPLDVDAHRIPANPRKGEGEHWHFDFRYLLRVPQALAPAAQPGEVNAAVWVPWPEAARRVDSLGRVWAQARQLGLLS